MEPTDDIVFHIDQEITDNIRAIFDRWRRLCNFLVDIYSIKDYKAEKDFKNGLAYSEYNQMWGAIDRELVRIHARSFELSEVT